MMSLNEAEQTLVERFQKFSDYTSMHGFTELFYARTAFWKFIWLVIIGASIGLTAYQVAGATQNFLDQASVTSIQPATTEDMLYPPLRICYPHWLYWVDFESALKMKFTKDAILYGLSYLTAIYTTNIINETEAKENYLRAMAANNFQTLTDFYNAIRSDPIEIIPARFSSMDEVSHTSLFYVDDTDSVVLCHLIDENNITSIIASSGSSSEIRSTTVGTKQSDKRKNDKLNNVMFHINYDKRFVVRQHVNDEEYGSYIGDWLNLTTPFKQSSATNLTLITLPMIVYPNTYDKSPVYVTVETDIVKISLKATIHKWKDTKQSKCESEWRWIAPNGTCKFNCIREHKMGLINASGDGTQRSITDGVYMNDFSLDIETNGFVNLHKKVAVVEETEFSTSQWNNTDIEDLVWVEQSTPDSDGLVTTVYQRLSENLTNCTKKCDSLYGCQLYTFDISQQQVMMFQTGGTYVERYYTKVVIEYPPENEVLVMKEEDSKTWEDFVGNVGGLLGIWTGASVISFLQLVYLCCCADCTNMCKNSIEQKVIPTNITQKNIVSVAELRQFENT